MGGMHGKGMCMAWGVHGREACVVGGMRGRGGMHGRGACMAGGCVWQGCVWQERWPLQRAVRILLECILVIDMILLNKCECGLLQGTIN